MAIFVTCTCGKRLQGKEEDAGKQTRCPFCGNVITLPAGPQAEESPWQAPQPPAPTPRPPAAAQFTCRVCGNVFGASEVYSEAGSTICKRCFERGDDAPEPAPRRDRWGEERPRPRRRRYEDDEDEDVIRAPRHRSVPTYLTESILCTLFCCWIFGIIAIVYAAQVNSHLDRGDYRAAQAASDSAKTWCGLSFGLGLVVIVLYVLFIVAAGGRGL